MLIVAVLFLIAAVALGGISVVALSGRLPRNRYLGVRTPATLRDEQTFRLANRVAAPTMAAGAFVLLLGGLGALLFSTVAGIVAVVVCLVAALVIAGIGGALGARAAESLPTPDDLGACGSSCGACSLKDACESAVGHEH
ncbi:SdpI family protein [Rhodococcus sp. D2-41]|uniref:SdpI family protein n=1 Tax=Speluncibacter jeojiensis TaxID=2710754 RepID=A0A9X4M0G5_9ACTN|nr:SdpI family protein [Rhodococcus sp. D2-41]MDG3009798.1 SdpI family protein [Rhodococcus sp. D2-41]MDG3014549.1 SdpI family protein [Corynebacteriales bacterium D3-21]